MSSAGLDRARAKMSNAGLDPVAVDTFAHYYRLLEVYLFLDYHV